MKIIRIQTILIALLCFTGMQAQKWYVGAGAGAHIGSLKYSNLNESYFPDSKSSTNLMFSVFGQAEFGNNQNFAIRPQLSILSRGGEVSGPSDDISLLRNYYQNGQLVAQLPISSQRYIMDVGFLDLRVPLVYQFLKADSKVRPYVMVAPVLGITTGGKLKFNIDFYDVAEAEQISTKVSKSNMQSLMFSAQVGAGLKFAIPLKGETCYAGLELTYELGLTDTYSDDEVRKYKASDPDSKPVNVNSNTRKYNLYGTRKMNGFEIQATFSVPFSIFKKKEVVVQAPAYIPPRPVPVPKVEKVEPVQQQEKPCYTLEEIQMMMKNNESVRGKVICAINDMIQFDFNKSVIKKVSYEYLNNLAETLKNVHANITICGHTDNVGKAEYNKKLSKQRAEAVMKYLIKKGVDATQLSAVGFGAEMPRASNDTEAGRSVNRRVEFEIAN